MPAPSAEAAPPRGDAPFDVWGTVHGRWKAEVVCAVVDLRIADHLDDDETLTAGELAIRAGLDPDRLHRVLVLAAAVGVFEQLDADTFAHNAASRLLRAAHPASMRVEARHILSAWQRTAWDGLDHAVRHGTSGFAALTGHGVFDHLRTDPMQAADFNAFQAQVTARNARALVPNHDFPVGATVVDVGGGTGALLRTILDARPDLRGVLLDAPAVAAAAPQIERMQAVGGDFFAAVPDGGDVYLLSHILHDWDHDDAVAILSRVAEAMSDGAALVVVENLRDDDDDLLISYLDVLMMTAWNSRERSSAEYAELMAEAGLAAPAVSVVEPRSGLALLVTRRRRPG